MSEGGTLRTGPRMLPLYLGPTLPRWLPRSIEDVQSALDDGTITERHWLDVKLEVASGDGSKKGIAKDLASFAVDGGALIIGIREDKSTQTLTIDPVRLAGLAESIEQIARSRCDPPVFTVGHEISADLDSNGDVVGVLIVEVPPSPSAPHMVDGRYYGRNDKTNYPLEDSRVAQLHAVRSMRQVTAEQLISAERARDPLPAERRKRSHLFVVAQPLSSPPDLVTPKIDDQSLHPLIMSIGDLVPDARSISPNWGYLDGSEPRPSGLGVRSYAMVGRQLVEEMEDAREENILDVEVHDSGRVVLFCGGASGDRAGEHVVWEDAIALLTRCVVTLAGEVGAATGYAGRWMLAVGVTDLAGKRSSRAAGTPLWTDHPPFSDSVYVQGTECVTTELLHRPGAITATLVRRLLRALGTEVGSSHAATSSTSQPDDESGSG